MTRNSRVLIVLFVIFHLIATNKLISTPDQNINTTIKRATSDILVKVKISPHPRQGVQGAQMAAKIEHAGEGNINTTCGGGDIYDVGSLSVVNQYHGQVHPRNALDIWLNGFGELDARQTNDYDYSSHENMIQEGTGEWLFSERTYLEWSSISSPSSNATCPNVLWFDGDAGFGKSVLCAHAIRHIRDLWESDKGVVVVYQFYKMGNESETPMTAFLNIAKMLFEERFKADDKVPDEIMAIAAYSPSELQLRKLIELLVRDFKAVYIFVDGLDEMLDAKENARWSRAKDFLKFILRLAVGSRSRNDDFNTVVKVWVSSQERKDIHEAIFSNIPATSTVSTTSSPSTTALAQIRLTQKLNQSDIGAMFRHKMTFHRSYNTLGGSEGISKVLEEVQLAVKGNFLWARLMMNSIADANSHAQAIEASKTVPEDFKTYLGNRIKAQLEKHPQQRRRDAALILSCLLYAQRPILDDELCDAVCAARILEPGQNVREEDRLFRDKIEEICAPLVKVDRMERDGRSVGICTLYHSDVVKILLESPSILVPDWEGDEESGDNEYILTPRVLGRACLRYLQQGRYKRPLLCPAATGGRGFLTSCQERQNIGTHAFLTYCAKYWARHQELEHAMSSIPRNRRDEIYKFISSSQFRTTLQVQSLFVEAQFRLVPSTGHKEKGIQLARAFPRFFTDMEEFPSGKRVQQQYYEAISEFGYYLDSLSRFNEQLAGQIDRCFWGMLGKSNLFRRMSSHLRSFKLETKRKPDDEARYLYHDGMIMNNKGIIIFSISSRSTGKNIRLELETFEIKSGRDPKHSHGEVDPVEVMVDKLELYRRPLREPYPGRPGAVLVSPDGRVLRVGSELFIHNGGSFRQLDLDGIPTTERMDFFEEVGSRGPWVAIGRRRNINSADLAEVAEECEAGVTSEGNDAMDVASSSGFSDTDCEDTTSVLEEIGPANSIEVHEPEALPHANDHQRKEDDATESDLESADNNSTWCSAPDSCSIRSTPTQSDEVGHGDMDEYWNDWFSDEEDLQLDELTDDNIMNGSDEPCVHQSLHDISVEIADAQDFDEKQSESDIASHLSAGHLEDDAWSNSDDSNNSKDVFYDDRPKLLKPSSTGVVGVKTDLCELLILNTDKSALAPLHSENDDDADKSSATEEKRTSLRVFRLAHKSSGLIFSSPPVIHPQHNLLVGPLGGDEVVFANFLPPDRSFFIARLGAGSGRRACHMSMQAQFSPCGRYLHIACLDAKVPESANIADHPIIQIKQLSLRVSTYRLSARKPERSMPRLVYSTACPLETTHWNRRQVRENDGINPLPWTLTWDWDDGKGGAHVYACQSNPCLRVVRAPLFAHVEARERELDGPETKDRNDTLSAFVNVRRVFLPFSAQCRRVRFFPHSSESSGAKKLDQSDDRKAQPRQRETRNGKQIRDQGKHGVGVGEEDDDPFVATVVVSSEDARNSGLDHARKLAGEYRGPAQVAQLKRSQFGDWKRLEYSDMWRSDKSGMRPPTRTETWLDQLLPKYEKFDKQDDYDIVPNTGVW